MKASTKTIVILAAAGVAAYFLLKKRGGVGGLGESSELGTVTPSCANPEWPAAFFDDGIPRCFVPNPQAEAACRAVGEGGYTTPWIMDRAGTPYCRAIDNAKLYTIAQMQQKKAGIDAARQQRESDERTRRQKACVDGGGQWDAAGSYCHSPEELALVCPQGYEKTINASLGPEAKWYCTPGQNSPEAQRCKSEGGRWGQDPRMFGGAGNDCICPEGKEWYRRSTQEAFHCYAKSVVPEPYPGQPVPAPSGGNTALPSPGPMPTGLLVPPAPIIPPDRMQAAAAKHQKLTALKAKCDARGGRLDVACTKKSCGNWCTAKCASKPQRLRQRNQRTCNAAGGSWSKSGCMSIPKPWWTEKVADSDPCVAKTQNPVAVAMEGLG